MASLWIVHRDARARAALRRLAGEEEALAGEPSAPCFEAAEPPDVVLLGLGEEFELELEFAHRFSSRLHGVLWILLPRPQDASEARRLFDTFPAEVLSYPPGAPPLRGCIQAGLAQRRVDSLSQRGLRDRLAARFARWFADLEFPELLRVLDPRLAQVPLLVRGESGCGRTLLAHYVHLFGTRPAGSFVSIRCSPETSCAELLEAMAPPDHARPPVAERLTVCLEDLDLLALREQRRVCRWIELTPPPGVLRCAGVRWMATLGDLDRIEGRDLAPELGDALAGATLRIPPLRERVEAIAPFAEATLSAWCQAGGERARRLDVWALEALRDHPWPGNLRELEAVLVRSLVASGSDPLTLAELHFDAEPPLTLPIDLEVGAEISEMEEMQTEAVLDEPLEIETLEVGDEAAPVRVTAPSLEPQEEPRELAPARVGGAPAQGERHESSDAVLRELACAVATEMRDPLAGLQRLAEIIPAQAAQADLRVPLGERTDQEAGRLAALAERLARFGSLEAPRPSSVNLAELLDEVLEQRRSAIQARRLLVLKELDREQPFAWVDVVQLRFALEGLLDRALARVPERGDLYLASKHHASGLAGKPCARVLLRFRSPHEPGGAAADLGGGPLELAIAGAVVRAHGGTVAVDASAADETLIVFDLPAPA
jgi:DNA-binding NtrC family response regulator